MLFPMDPPAHEGIGKLPDGDEFKIEKKKIYAFDSKAHLCPIFWVPTKRMSFNVHFMSHLLGPKIKRD